MLTGEQLSSAVGREPSENACAFFQLLICLNKKVKCLYWVSKLSFSNGLAIRPEIETLNCVLNEILVLRQRDEGFYNNL